MNRIIRPRVMQQLANSRIQSRFLNTTPTPRSNGKVQHTTQSAKQQINSDPNYICGTRIHRAHAVAGGFFLGCVHMGYSEQPSIMPIGGIIIGFAPEIMLPLILLVGSGTYIGEALGNLRGRDEWD